MSLSQVTAVPGAQLTVTATGYPAGAQVTFTLDTTPPIVLGTVTADANGTATLAFTLPKIGNGTYVISANGNPLGNCQVDPSTNLAVDAATATTAATGTLPRTGTNTAELVQLALVLIAVGGLVTLATRKRRQQSSVGS